MILPHKNTPSEEGYVDLHIHSTASDGSFSPTELVETAQRARLRAIAITDHDTLEGCVEALELKDSQGVEVLSGIELSVAFGSGTLHLLGYLIQPDDPGLKRMLRVIQESRAGRNVQIMEKLQKLGLDVKYHEVCALAGKGQVGRPHIAQTLVKKGFVLNIEEAFIRFLKRGKSAYEERYRPPADQAIQVILGSGGVPVLAHPHSVKTGEDKGLEEIVRTLKQVGLRGIEAYYPTHGTARIARYKRLAQRHGLLVTGGTDFHGAVKPQVHLGVGTGDLRVPYGVVEDLKRAAAEPMASPRSDGMLE